jgi:phage shock protein A
MSSGGNTPNLDQVRDKIERRYANALGSAELAQNSVQGRMLEVEQASTQMAGHSRLEQIRASMAEGGQLGSGTGATGQLGQGQSESAAPPQQQQAQTEQQ